MSGEQKYKEGDALRWSAETSNRAEILFFTDRAQVYKCRLSDFDDTKASVLGEYLPTRLSMDEGENVFAAVLPGDYGGTLLFFFENGKAARVELGAYQTVSNRRRLTGAYSDRSPLVCLRVLGEDEELAVRSAQGRALIFHTAQLSPKTTRSTQGVQVMNLKKNDAVLRVAPLADAGIVNPARYRVRAVPAAGAPVRAEDAEEKQISLLEEDKA
jgi:DNA gyrase subunit A